MTIWPFVFTSLVVGRVSMVPWLLDTLLTSLSGFVSLFSILSKAHLGYLQWVSAFLPTTNEVKTKGHIVIPYTQGLCESITICSRYGIQTHVNGGNTIKNLPVSQKDKDLMENRSGATYWFQCGDLACDEEYIGENSRTLGERFKEHLNEPSPIYNHCNNTGHPTTQDNFQILGREGHVIARTIKESIYIRGNIPTLNRNIGKFNLHHIWDRVLLNTPGLKIKRHVQDIGHAQCTQANIPMQFFTGSMEHAQRTPLSEHVHRTS